MPLQTAAHTHRLGCQDHLAHQPPLPGQCNAWCHLSPLTPARAQLGTTGPALWGTEQIHGHKGHVPCPHAQQVSAFLESLGALACLPGPALPLNKGPHSPPPLCCQLPCLPCHSQHMMSPPTLDEASVALTPGSLLTLEHPSLTPLGPLPSPLFPSLPQAIPLKPSAKVPRSSI